MTSSGSSGATLDRGDDRSTRIGSRELAVTLPADTPPQTVRTVEALLAQIDELIERTAQLQVALESRVVIEQAKGVLSERLGISPEEAFERLRSAARSRRIPLRRLAVAIVEDRAGLSE